MSHDLTRWIENAEARRFGETVMLDLHADVPAHHRSRLDLHLGDAIAHLPCWLRHAHAGHPPANRRPAHH